MNETKPALRVGFIGIGNMGLPMGTNLLKAGYEVLAFDLAQDRLDEIVARGAVPAVSVAQVARESDAIVTSLPNDKVFRAVALGPDGVVENARTGAVLMDTSTVSATVSAEVADAALRRGVQYLRSTVSGNGVVAAAAALTVMASGPKDAYELALPLINAIGRREFYLGQAEEARLMKLAVNLMISVSSGMIGEALTLGRKSGLDWSKMLDVLASSHVASPMVLYKVPPLKDRDFTSTMSAITQTKDVDLILDCAAQSHVPLPLTSAVRGMFQGLISMDGGEDDYIALVKHVETLSGVA
ncbi:3-hydroxyisobutyrate dehydrogenase [Paraburkholderia unamae]|uniref:NAD(P)-dependent oxidoreductase n=1 Tax=Paraburkholderia unamae TaxID=219649 RepID=UPI000DC576D6|nr:NAD(P)-dependent oxidoreductase [Paraburkholderia unamae]RAR54519.1 3-hydroxyisobutyrate dehydrogenase [Paraburkholderia unamae]